jgi:hypothetical protein
MTSTRIEADRALIARLGGSTKVAEMLGYPAKGGAQRVSNWKARGIPPGVKLDHPHIFLWRFDAQPHAGGVAHA